MSRWIIAAACIYLVQHVYSNECSFNPICTCIMEDNSVSVSCISIPLYKFPNIPEGDIKQVEFSATKISSIDNENLKNRKIQALILHNNQLQHLSNHAFSSSSGTLSSLDLSNNRLSSIPFQPLKELSALLWMNLHGNEISSTLGDWSYLPNTLETLFLGENDLISLAVISNVSSNYKTLLQLNKLRWLNLDKNRISRIYQNSFPASLQTISLSHNLISDFPLDVIETLPFLRWLYLKGNYISYMRKHKFLKPVWLEKLDVSANFLQEFPGNHFSNSLFIRELNLAFNELKTLESNNFYGFQCGKIILSHNFIETIDVDAFAGIEETLEYLDFDHNNLQIIPPALDNLKSLKYLYLSSNLLTQISESAFSSFCSNLKALSLSGNNLTKIPSQALRNCRNISYFNIGFNKIYEINTNDFSTWGENIKNLMLNNNKITTLRNIFADLISLEELSLSFNPLRIIEADTLRPVKSLRSLEISFSLDQDEQFQKHLGIFQNIQWLSIDRNDLYTLDDYSLSNLHKLEYFNVEFNRINFLSSNLFNSKTHLNLKEIRLSHNKLTVIKSDTFSELKNLETIILANNKIEIIQTKSFINLPVLNKLVLSNNNINFLNIEAFSNLPSLIHVDLHNNKIRYFNFNVFVNTTNYLYLNLSLNQMSSCFPPSILLNLTILDLKLNNFEDFPNCLQNVGNLRKLHLDFNIITKLENNIFLNLSSLEYLTLQQNNIMQINQRAFSGLKSLQVLDLSKNMIDQLYFNQFTSLLKLRILDLQDNKLTSLPKDLFSDTTLEEINLSRNMLSVVPSSSIYSIGASLRSLNLNSNKIEHLDVTTFPQIPHLQYLDLSNNKLSILPDNVFTACNFLESINLASNPIRANFKELFHYAQRIKSLSLAGSGMRSTPYIPLPQLINLNLSHNYLEYINKNTFQDLTDLKYLDLSHNHFTEIPSYVWVQVPNMKYLDISFNPIRVIGPDSFNNLPSLQTLNIQFLKYLDKFEVNALLQLKVLTTLFIETWLHIENFKDGLCKLFTYSKSLRKLHILFTEQILNDHLHCLINKHIKYLEIKGEKLTNINRNAFIKITNNPHLFIKITDTSIDELPPGLFSNMFRIQYLKIDLNNNMLTSLSPEIFYGNATVWNNVGTTLISGGLSISGNAFRCGCHLAWLGHWLRRWTRESLQSHNVPVKTALEIYDITKDATCIHNDQSVPILELSPEDITCQASALSNNSQTVIYEEQVLFYILVIFWFIIK